MYPITLCANSNLIIVVAIGSDLCFAGSTLNFHIFCIRVDPRIIPLIPHSAHIQSFFVVSLIHIPQFFPTVSSRNTLLAKSPRYPMPHLYRPTPIPQRLPFFFFVLAIRLVILLWNPSSTIIIASVTTNILLPYSTTDCTIALYIIAYNLIVAPIFPSTFSTILHLIRDFRKFL